MLVFGGVEFMTGITMLLMLEKPFPNPVYLWNVFLHSKTLGVNSDRFRIVTSTTGGPDFYRI